MIQKRHYLRTLTLVCASFILLVTILAGDSVASDQGVAPFSQAAEAFLPQAQSPLLFVGRIVDLDSGRMVCTFNNHRYVTYAVRTVSFGFAPSGGLKVAYPGCAKSDAPHAYAGEVLVLATYIGHDLWNSRRELVLPATAANIGKAQSLLSAELKRRISRYTRHHGLAHHRDRVVVFEGTVRDPVPHLQEPIVCTVQPVFPVNCDVEQLLYGDWTDKEMVVHFGTCSNLPDPPIRAGQRMIVFAYVSPGQSQVYGDLNMLFAPEQMAQVRAALGLQ
jgi:hypothetical protein